jgi:membrane protease YdiL (CAAX protease family)
MEYGTGVSEEGKVEGPPAVKPNYFRITKSATYGFLAALPLLVIYEVLILLANGDSASQIRVGADVWVKQLLALFGTNTMLPLSILVVLIGVAVLISERKKKLPIKPSYLGWMVGESAVYAIVVALLVSSAVGLIFSVALQSFSPEIAQSTTGGKVGSGMMLILSIGAGLYEELIFRVVLVGGLFWALNRWMGKRKTAYILAALAGALIFSAVHYMGPLGDAFELSSFTFRFLFGLALNGIFLARGFGVAAWTHALYDVLVVTHLLG